MSKEHVFFGKFRIKEKDGTDEYEVSAEPLSAKEKDALAGIVRCRDCERYEWRKHLGRSYCRGEFPTEPDGFCAWAKRKEVAE